MLHFSNEISIADQAFEGSFLITAPPIVNLWILKQPLAFLLLLPSLVFLSPGDEAQHIDISTLLLVENAYCILAAASLFDFFL